LQLGSASSPTTGRDTRNHKIKKTYTNRLRGKDYSAETLKYLKSSARRKSRRKKWAADSRMHF
jgi:hypothetical protein